MAVSGVRSSLVGRIGIGSLSLTEPVVCEDGWQSSYLVSFLKQIDRWPPSSLWKSQAVQKNDQGGVGCLGRLIESVANLCAGFSREGDVLELGHVEIG